MYDWGDRIILLIIGAVVLIGFVLDGKEHGELQTQIAELSSQTSQMVESK